MVDIRKDYTKLKDVSEHFTEETLRKIISTKLNGEYQSGETHVWEWEFDKANAKGDNYLSTVYKIKVTGITGDKKDFYYLVVKSLPKNVGRRNTFRSVEFFQNEIMFYTKVIPKFEKFLIDKGQEKILYTPRHLASCMDGENDYIAMQDVTFLGYEPLSRQNSMNGDQCAVILKTIARFHAISFAYKDQKKEEFTELMENLRETYFSKDHWNWYKRFHKTISDITKNALAIEYPGSEAEKRYNSHKFGDLYHMAAEFCNRKYQPTSVICHGDCWAPNFLFRKVDENHATMLDFQLARCASPIVDLSTCIYACTEKTLWDKQFDELLKIYYNELSDTITLLGSNPESLYSWDTFMSEVKEQFIFGAIFAMEIIPLSLLDESDTFDLDALISNDTKVDIADVWTLSNIESQDGRRRLANVFLHATQHGFL
ncbi:uncharacterized protein LOC122395399 [Colletes gigas]|uniref:uncharacterized protein LOC122395399 n=1 Tax=Colletes gigas TaxID=935657 RepID=UPI001C9A2E69|nr:uncharacterized protein LOC122395399 [Colletes gigas]XP_043248873.1 uncharacterized protein LOC122395399 [Colletes gigas]XP_043248874.1 uncharacterized protein LOC122395399 [Colletes gigas]